MLTLPIKRKWFDMIASGEKTEEYRNITRRYTSMFQNAADENGNFWCVLRNGYSRSSPTLKVYVHYSIGKGQPQWGAEPNLDYFILRILKKESGGFTI